MRELAKEIVKLAKEVISESDLMEKNGLNGMSKVQAKRFVNGLLAKHTKGLFRDESWVPINKTFRELLNQNVLYELTETRYHQDDRGEPNSKDWRFEIPFVNDKGRETILYGIITAHGAGTVEDPLSRYDITAYVTN